mgnify:CR=1 FL=1
MSGKRLKALLLREQGFSFRQIALLLRVSHSTVLRWIRDERKGKKGRPPQKLELPEQIEDKIKKFLEHRTDEKGKSRVLSLSQIYKALELELREVGINSLYSFYRYIKQYIREEYGSVEKLETKRRDKKELHKFKNPKGRIERRKGWVEVDATGYTYAGKQYSILVAQDEETGFILGYYVVENKEKDAKHYNKAFNELDYMYFLLNIAKNFGLPVGIKSDNEKFLTSKNVRRALKELGVVLQRAKAYNPQQKLIERTFRDIKEKLRLISAIKSVGIEELLEEAVDLYNKEEHQYIAGSWVPAERFTGYEKVDEDRLRLSLCVEEERTCVNGYIRFDNKTYEFRHEELEKEGLELGRRGKYPKVKVRIDLEDNTKAWVFKEGKLLGVARLITVVEETSTLMEKEQKQQAKRIEKRKKALKEELYALENTPKVQEEKEEVLEVLSQAQNPEEVKREEKEGDIDILEILLGGET